MGKYTCMDHAAVDFRIEQDLWRIKSKILQELGSHRVSSIVLYGSFGRGEGSVTFHNNGITPLNDYDISVFLNWPYSLKPKKYNSICEGLSNALELEIDIKQIDLSVTNLWRFLIRRYRLFYTISTHDYVHGYKVLYGRFNIDRLSKYYLSSKIPLIEGAKFLYTRGIGLLLLSYVKDRGIMDLEAEVAIDYNKICIALGDSFLVFKGVYNTSYLQRLEICESLSFEGIPYASRIKELYGYALKRKLYGRQLDMHVSLDDCIEVSNIFISYSIWFESRRLKCDFDSVGEYIDSMINQRMNLTQRVTKSHYFILDLCRVLLLANWYGKSNKETHPSQTNILFNLSESKNGSSWSELAEIFLRNKLHSTKLIRALND